MTNIPSVTDIEHIFNQTCPLTGESIKREALAFHQGVIIGFSQVSFRDRFIENPQEFPTVRAIIEKAHIAMKNKEYNPRLRWFGRRIGPGMSSADREIIYKFLPQYEISPTDTESHGLLSLQNIFTQKKYGWKLASVTENI